MTGLRQNYLGALKVLVLIFLILGVSIFFGQVMGGFYLGSLTRSDHLGDNIIGGSTGKKVLRLKIIDYYTVQAASFKEKDSAVKVGNALAEKGLPVVVTGKAPYRVLFGFVNDQSKLAVLAGSIRVEGQKVQVIKGQINSTSFKFDPQDSFARDQAAPFLGGISTSLEKALLLYNGITVLDEDISRYKGKFSILARELDDLAGTGKNIAADNKDSVLYIGIAELSRICGNWAQGLHKLEGSWNDAQLILTQQQALVLLEEYHCFIDGTN